jgi:hypothetical protein
LQITGNNKVISKEGIYEFTNIKFIAKPNFTTQISFSSDAIDQLKVQKVTNKSNGKGINNPSLGSL